MKKYIEIFFKEWLDSLLCLLAIGFAFADQYDQASYTMASAVYFYVTFRDLPPNRPNQMGQHA